MERIKDKDDKPKSVGDHWINPVFLKECKPGSRGIVSRTGGKPVEKKGDEAK